MSLPVLSRSRIFLPRLCSGRSMVLTLLAVCWLMPGSGIARAQSSLRSAASELVKSLHQDDDVKKLKGERIIVAEFENINGLGDAVPRSLQEMVITEFVRAKHFKVVERSQLDKAVKELKLGLSDIVDADNARKIGKIVGASYIVVGSISQSLGSVSVNARIFSIERAEIISATDATLSNVDLADTGGRAKAEPEEAVEQPLKTNEAVEQSPKLNLDEKRPTNVAGQWLSPPRDFGLVGASKFVTAWRTTLLAKGEDNFSENSIKAFAAGDVLGNGSARLVTGSGGGLYVWKWDAGKFIVTTTVPTGYGGEFLEVIPVANKPSIISVPRFVFSWNGTNYVENGNPACAFKEWPGAKQRYVFGVKNLGGYGEFIYGLSSNATEYVSGVMKPMTFPTDGISQSNDAAISGGDLDGDGKVELAVINQYGSNTGDFIRIFGIDGKRKAITNEEYSYPLTVWHTGGKFPFIVATKNVQGNSADSKGGYVFLLQWDGEMYRKMWKSVRMDEQILDIQVCNPKSEAKSGLVVLSKDDNGYYLTKIEPAN